MPSTTTVIRLDRGAADIWNIISNVERPETWIPFLDSRTLSSAEDDEWVYFPSELASICPDRITFNVIANLPADQALEFSLTAGPIHIVIRVAIHAISDGSFLEVTGYSDIPVSQFPEINELLADVSKGLAKNIELISSMRCVDSSGDGSKSGKEANLFSSLLSARHPEMNVNEIKRISLSDGLEKIMAETIPAVITDFGQKQPNYASLSQFSWWNDQFGSQTVPFMIFKELTYDKGTVMGRTTLCSLIETIKSNPNGLRFATYEYPAYRILGLHRHLSPPSIIPSDCPLLNINVWIGTSYIKSPMHQDGRGSDCTGKAPDKAHNLNFQVCGRKHVILSHPNQSKYLYPKPPSLHKDRFPEVEVDFFSPLDFGRFPEVKNAQLFETVLNPGELLYIPRGWWHAFYSLENSINYNVFFSSDKY